MQISSWPQHSLPCFQGSGEPFGAMLRSPVLTQLPDTDKYTMLQQLATTNTPGEGGTGTPYLLP